MRFSTFARIGDGVIDLQLDLAALAALLAVPADKIDPGMLAWSLPFSHRRCGVEARLTIGEPIAERDDILIANIARATSWLEEMKAGADYASIAGRHGTSANYVAEMLPFALLAPNLVRSVLAGRHPTQLTTNWLRRHGLPDNWAKQARIHDDA